MKQFLQYQIKCLILGIGVSATLTACIAAIVFGIQLIEAEKTEGQRYAMTLAEYYESKGIEDVGIEK